MRSYFRYLGILTLSILLLGFVSCGNKDKTFVEGDNKFKIKDYNLQKQGFRGLEEMFREHTVLPSTLSIESFEGSVSKEGILDDFNLLIYGYDESKEYIGVYRFTHDSKRKVVNYAGPASGISTTLPQTFNENSEISYLDKELKKLPISQEISKLDFSQYEVSYSANTKPDEGEPIIKEGNNQVFPILTFDEYKSGKGGISDGHTAVIFTLSDGVDLYLGGSRIMYSCSPANSEDLYGNKNNYMKKDYYINGPNVKVSRDYGENWIEIPLSEEDINETLDFYRMGIEIPEDSFYISDDIGGIIAFIYGKDPKILFSQDDGANWRNIDFTLDLEKPITRRCIGFINNSEGYMAFGTDWSMGTGEGKVLYVTSDGGANWTKKDMPLQNTSNTLTGLKFADIEKGIVSLDGGSESNNPILYATIDRGETWQEINIPWDTMTDDVQYLSKIDSVVFEEGVYKLTLGQGEGSNKKALFESNDIYNSWRFIKSFDAVIHYNG